LAIAALIYSTYKYAGDFTEADERSFVVFAGLVSMTLEALWEVRTLRKAGT